MTPTTAPTTAVLYARCSTDSQGLDGLGINHQIEAARKWADQHGVQIISEHKEVVSGKAPIEKRCGLVAAMASVVANRAGILLVAKMDRVSRDMLTTMTIEKSLLASGARLVSVEGEGTESDDATAVFTRRIMAAVSELECSLISARTKCALAQKKKNGERLGKPRRGFRVQVDAEGGRKLVKSADWDLVRDCLMLREGGASWIKCAEILGVTPQGARQQLRKWEGGVQEFLKYTHTHAA